MTAPAVQLLPLSEMPLIGPGADLTAEILAGLERNSIKLEAGDIVVVAQKIVSKAEGRLVHLGEVAPSARAHRLAEVTRKDPRLLEVVLSESREVLRAKPNVIIVEHRLGHVMANAGIDRSNLDVAPKDEDVALLLPEDPDRAARALRAGLEQATGVRVGVIITDSFGRAWRLGTVGVAIGVAGPPVLVDRRGDADLKGRPLEVTEVGFADAVAAAAVLVMGEGNEGRPVLVVRGLDWPDTDQRAADVVRPRSEDLFR